MYSTHEPTLHRVQFYETDEVLFDRVAEFLCAGLAADDVVVAIATEAHRHGFLMQLQARGFDVGTVCASGRLVLLDAGDLLARVLVDGAPDPERFQATIGSLATRGRVRMYGEMVDLLWRAGNRAAAARLEAQWNELATLRGIQLLHGYALPGSDTEPLEASSAEPMHAVAAEIARRRAAEAELQRVIRALEATQELERARERRMALLQEATVRLASAVSLAELTEVVLSTTDSMLHAEATVLYLAGEDGRFRLAAHRNVPDAARRWAELPLDAQVPLARAIAGAEPLWLESYEAFAAAFPDLQTSMPPGKLQAIACMPLFHGGRVIGGIAMSFDTPRAFSQEQRDWLISFASQCAVAVERARLYEAERRARDEAETLYRIAESLNTAQLDLDATLQRVTDAATSLTGATIGAFVPNAAAGSHLPVTISDLPRDALEGPRDTPLSAPTFAGTQIVRIDDVTKDPRHGVLGALWPGHPEVTSYLAVPVVSRTATVLGGLFLGHAEPARFTAQHERMMTVLATNAAVAVENARLLRAARDAGETQRRAAEELAETVRLNELFGGILAHDLRNPLGAITAGAELLIARAQGDMKPAHRILASAYRMARMIEQMLDFSRIRMGTGLPLDLKPSDLTPLIGHVVEELRAAHPQQTIRLAVNGAIPRGTWDVDRLAQAFSNLIGNAAQHGRLEHGVDVRVTAGDDHVTISIHNAGAIPADAQSRLFEPMTGGRRRRDGSLGLGLGLFITQAIVRAHGGQLAVRSTESEGTTFDVTLPREAAPQPLAPHAGARRRERDLRRLVESVRDYAIFMLDPDGRVATWNEGARIAKGYSADEIIGQSGETFYLPEERGRFQMLLRRAIEQGRVEDEGWRVRKDGSRFWADVIITALRDEGGELIGFAKITRDLTERKQAEEQIRRSEERFRLMVESVKDYAIFMLDERGHVVTWNAGAERVVGYRADEIIGSHISRFYPPEVSPQRSERELELATRDGRSEEEGWRVRKDGSRFWSNVVLTAARNAQGELAGFVKVTRDLTERRKLEDELVRVAHAQEGIRLRDEFLSIVSHELKTPLTGLQLHLDTLEDQLAGAEPKVIDKLRRASASSTRLCELIDTVLDVSRIATGRFALSREQSNLAAVVREVVDSFLPVAGRAGSLLVAELVPLAGLWDRVRVQQMVTNLLTNAFKYAPGAPIDVRLFVEGSEAVIEVRDRGPGVPVEALPLIFDRFERAVPARNYGGLGIGLYVVREIAEAHGGSASGRNGEGGGAVFTVRLPIVR